MCANPIRLWRQAAGLKLADLARKLQLSYHQLWRVEVGHVTTVSPRVARGLVGLGYPGDPVADYRNWRNQMT